MKVIGITGGVGSGKSEVLNYMKEAFGAVICQMDETARELQKKGTGCYEKIVEYFGRDILAQDGELDRQKLGAIVFSDPEKLQALNGIVHPEVFRQVREEIRENELAGVPVYVVEAALLTEEGRALCEEFWYIYTSEEVRRERLKKSRGYTDEKITQMIASQPGEEEFRRAATAVIDNSGTLEDTKRQIGELLR